MGHLATVKTAGQRVLAPEFDLERQLRATRRHYAEARNAADQAREEWRALTVHPGVRPEAIQAARAKFEAVAARCNRLFAIIEDLEDRL